VLQQGRELGGWKISYRNASAAHEARQAVWFLAHILLGEKECGAGSEGTPYLGNGEIEGEGRLK